MSHPLRLLFAVTALCCLAGTARADVPPPETQPCSGKQVGAACTYNGAGTCQESTCSRLDYAHWDRDASSSPPSMNYACVKCLPLTNTNTNTATETETGTDTDTDTDTDTGTDTDTRTASNTNTNTSLVTDTDTNTSTDTGKDTAGGDDGCSIARTSTGKRIAPWLLAGAFSLIFLFGRRRRR